MNEYKLTKCPNSDGVACRDYQTALVVLTEAAKRAMEVLNLPHGGLSAERTDARFKLRLGVGMAEAAMGRTKSIEEIRAGLRK